MKEENEKERQGKAIKKYIRKQDELRWERIEDTMNRRRDGRTGKRTGNGEEVNE